MVSKDLQRPASANPDSTSTTHIYFPVNVSCLQIYYKGPIGPLQLGSSTYNIKSIVTEWNLQASLCSLLSVFKSLIFHNLLAVRLLFSKPKVNAHLLILSFLYLYILNYRFHGKCFFGYNLLVIGVSLPFLISSKICVS